jgi:hypothetical protein
LDFSASFTGSKTNTSLSSSIGQPHAAVLSALVETATGYRFYFGIYVRNVSRFTPFYMALVDPFRRLIVCPSLLRSVRARWNQAFGSN